MSCYSCSTKFSFTKKEKSCELCHLSYCKNCLSYETKSEGCVKKVCKSCHGKVSNTFRDYDDSDPPALLLKRLETLENPSKPPITIFRSDPKVEKLKSGLSAQDLEILERLQKLKEKKSIQVVPSEVELRSRLLALQGKPLSDGSAESNQPVIAKTSFVAQTDEQQIDSLLMQYLDEIKINEDAGSSTEMEVDEEKEINAVISRAIEEAALPEVPGTTEGELTPPNFEAENDDMPWCEICNNDAVLRCLSCDGALYCTRCFREGHDFLDLKEHKTVPYNKQNPGSTTP